jgi:hypothetical protein
MKDKFFGICIIIAALLISGAVFYSSFFDCNRYKVAGAKVFDTQEGKFVENQASIAQTTTIATNQSSIFEALDNSSIQCDIQIPVSAQEKESGTKESEKLPAWMEPDTNESKYSSERRLILGQNNLKMTVRNISTKHTVKYAEIELRLYKGDVMFLKDVKIIGDEKSININPLSSYETSYQLDSSINYPDKPWDVEVIIKSVKGVPLE